MNSLSSIADSYDYEEEISLNVIHGRLYRKSKISYPDMMLMGSDIKKVKYQPGEALITADGQKTFDNLELDDIELTKNEEDGIYTFKMKVNNKFYGRILGAKGKTKKAIERNAKVTINVPRKWEKNDIIVIKGKEKSGILIAKRRIEEIVQKALYNQPYTHFISIPLNTNDIQPKIVDFYNELEERYFKDEDKTPRDFEHSIFMEKEKLHLTLLMLRLNTEEDKMKAIKTLKKASAEIYDLLKTRTKMIKLKGIDIMKGSPEAAHVVHIMIEEDSDTCSLVDIAEHLQHCFVESKLVPPSDTGVKLHATIFNTLHRKKDSSSKSKKRRITFDARDLLSTFSEYEFGNFRCESIHLSQRFTYDDNGYYHCEHKIDLP